MALIFHYGCSGAGKSTGLYSRIIKEAIADLHTNYLIIVPEQFTLQTQRDVIAMHPSGGIINIDVLSFLRLAYRIFEELGQKEETVLEDTGKSMIIKKVLLDKKDKLKLFGSKIHQQGFIEEMKSVISEFFQYDISVEDIERMKQLAKGRHLLEGKLEDVMTIYTGFKDFIEGRFITNEEVLDKLCEVAEASDILHNSVICLDGYTGFTPSQYKLIKYLMRRVKDIHVTITIDERDLNKALPEHSLFYLSFKTIRKLKEIADEKKTKIEEVSYGSKLWRFKTNKDMAALEHNLFRYPISKHSQSENRIRLISAASCEEEIVWVICQINKLVREQRYHYSDIAVVTGAADEYSRIVDREFKKAKIPFFIDEKHGIMGNPLVGLINALLDIAGTDYSYESIFRYIKCGLGPISESDASILENYVIAKGIRGQAAWGREWKTSYKTRYELNMNQINDIREKVFNSISETCRILEAGKLQYSILEKMKALYHYLVQENIEERIYEKAEQDKLSPDPEKRLEAKENEQIFKVVIEIFDRIVALLGEDILSSKEFVEILTTGFKEAKMRLIPPGTDSVVIGDIVRTRLKDIKALFFIGVNDGIIPKANPGGGIISDAERTLFSENLIELSPTKRQNAYMNEFYLYLNMTKPSERLFITFHRLDSAGKTVRPSYLLGKLKKLFPDTRIEYPGEVSGDIDFVLGTDRGISSLIEAIRDKDINDFNIQEKTLLCIYRAEEKSRLNHLIDAAFYTPPIEQLGREVGRKLYGEVLLGSVTRMEQYAACAFAHFLRYGLGLEERTEYSLRSIDMGNIYHKAIELFGVKLKERGTKWHSITEELLSELKQESLLEAAAEYSGILESTKRNAYIMSRLNRVLERTLRVIKTQISAGSFEPEFYEKSFQHINRYMNLRGKIDRIDICESNGKRYLRVIDYKSGNSSFDLNKLYYGLQIQLAVYIEQGVKLLEGNGRIVPAGLFYYNIDDPIVNKSDNTDEDLLKALRMNGPINSNIEAAVLHDNSLINAMGSIAPSVKSLVVQAETDKSGNLSARSKLLTSERFKLLTDYTDELLCESGKRIIAGDASVNPYRMNDKTACDYCIYKTVCRFDCRLGSSYRELRRYSEDDIWQHVNGQMNKAE